MVESRVMLIETPTIIRPVVVTAVVCGMVSVTIPVPVNAPELEVVASTATCARDAVAVSSNTNPRTTGTIAENLEVALDFV